MTDLTSDEARLAEIKHMLSGACRIRAERNEPIARDNAATIVFLLRLLDEARRERDEARSSEKFAVQLMKQCDGDNARLTARVAELTAQLDALRAAHGIPPLEALGLDTVVLTAEVARETMGKLIAAEKRVAELTAALRHLVSACEDEDGWSDVADDAITNACKALSPSPEATAPPPSEPSAPSR